MNARSPDQNRPVIFLDIDGVLTPFDGDGTLDVDCVDRLARIVNASKAAVVISSSWRHQMSLDRLRERLSDAGFRGPIVDVTPTVLGATREDEILAWLARAPKGLRFLVLDDALPAGRLNARWLVTDETLGLQDDDVERAIGLLALPIFTTPAIP